MCEADEQVTTESLAVSPAKPERSHEGLTRLYQVTCEMEYLGGLLKAIVDTLDDAADGIRIDPVASAKHGAALARLGQDYLEVLLQRVLIAEGMLANRRVA